LRPAPPFPARNAAGPVIAQKPALALANDPNNLSYDCLFQDLRWPYHRSAAGCRAGHHNIAGHITITCATAGAPFFTRLMAATLPRNGTLYAAPFTPGAGLTLNARAWLAGYLAKQQRNPNDMNIESRIQNSESGAKTIRSVSASGFYILDLKFPSLL